MLYLRMLCDSTAEFVPLTLKSELLKSGVGTDPKCQKRKWRYERWPTVKNILRNRVNGE